MDVLSAEWFAATTPLLVGCRARPGLDAAVQFEAPGAGRWRIVIDDGVLRDWAMGDLQRPDLTLRWTDDAAAASHYRAHTSGTDALASVSVLDDDRRERLPSPLDILETDELAALSAVPGGDLLVQYHFAAGPFGPVDYWWQFAEGRSDQMGFGTRPDPDCDVWISYQAMVRVRRGECSILQALEDGGDVAGDIGPLMLLAGIEETPEMREAEEACGRSGPVLAALGAHRADPDVTRAWQAVAEVSA